MAILGLFLDLFWSIFQQERLPLFAGGMSELLWVKRFWEMTFVALINLSRKDGVVCAEPERRRGQTAGSILYLLCVTVSFIFKSDTDLEEQISFNNLRISTSRNLVHQR